MLKTERTKTDLNEELKSVQEGIDRVKGEKQDAEKELANLEEELPGLMADLYLGDGSKKSEVTKMKKRRAELQEFLEERELILKGLEAKLTPLKDEKAKSDAAKSKEEGDRKRIEFLKKEILKFSNDPYGISLEQVREIENYMDELMRLSNRLGCLEDAKVFLQGLNEKELGKYVRVLLNKYETSSQNQPKT